MAKRVTEEDKILINTLYLKLGTYSGVAKETGFSPATVKKYIVPNFQIPEVQNVTRFKEEDIPVFDYTSFLDCENWGCLCVLSDDEVRELEALKEELVI